MPTSQPTQPTPKPEEEPYPYEQPVDPPPADEVLTDGGITLTAAQLVCVVSGTSGDAEVESFEIR